jgi:hypothetical protein
VGAMEPGLGALLVALPLWLLVTSLPGFLIATALDPGRAVLERWAVAPAISVAVGFAAASVGGRLGGRAVPAAATALALASLVSLLVVLRRPRIDRRPTVTPAGLVVVGVVAIALVAWFVVLGTSPTGWGSVLPNIDGSSHGVMVSRILASGSVDWPDVLRFDLAGADSDGQFYVLGLHSLVAVVAAVTGVPAALLVAFVVAGTLWLVLGVVALGRRVATERSALVAGAVAALMIPLLPAATMAWGLLPLVAAVGLVPGVALVLLDVGPGRRLALAALALAGLASMHTTEVLVVGLLVVLTWLLGGDARSRAASVGWAAVATALAMVVALPTTLGLATGGADRASDVPLEGSWDSALVVTLSHPFLGYLAPIGAAGLWLLLAAACCLVLTIVGCRILWAGVAGRGLVVVLLLLVALAVAADVGVRWPVLSPWYASGERITTQLAALLPVALGVGWVRLLDLARGAERRGLRAGVVVLGVAVALPLVLRSTETAHYAVADQSVVTEADRASFGWLSAHVRPGERILNDNRDGSVWMFDSTRGTAVPVFSAMPGPGWEATPGWEGRLHLRDTIADVSTDAITRDEAREWSVRYVVVGERTIGGGARAWDPEALAASPGLRLVFSQGDARVYEIVGS